MNNMPALGTLLLVAALAPAIAQQPAPQTANNPAASAATPPSASPGVQDRTALPVRRAGAAAAERSAAPPSASTPRARSAARVTDRVELEATQITGNRELPKVLYIVPWKRPDLGDLAGKPLNSLLDEVLAPVDRDVFRRENRYFEALRPDRAGGSAAPASPAGAPSEQLRNGSQAGSTPRQ
ncbi:MAG: hypothetical protein NZM12_04100 [Steroidobacteraceae bacterium]|nr:hypothetical protein [Steroidobacteraceae bacterium]MDW8258222.1 hypothetical protein [Gammaproteobacteria bacterium]